MSLIADPAEAQDHIGNEIMSKQISTPYNNLTQRESIIIILLIFWPEIKL
jgi:hypothetical protein